MSASPVSAPARVRILSTGGTIAGVAEAASDHGYLAGVVGVDDLIAAVPGLTEIAEVTSESLFSLDSVEMDLPRQLRLAHKVAELLARDDIDAVVVTHGTDTLEESAYLLHLVLRSVKPVVFVSAMRPGDHLGADGPSNLLNGVRVAAAAQSRGLGTLVVVGEEIHSARDLRKEHTTRVNAFASAYGPLGEVTADAVVIRHQPVRRYGAGGEFDIADLGEELPRVECLVTRADMPAELLETMTRSGLRGVVHLGPGAGNVPERAIAALAAAVADGVVVVRSTRVAGGTVERNGAVPDDRYGFVAGDDLGPYKARVLLALALAGDHDARQIQRLFDTH